MLKNYLKMALRNLHKNKLYSFISIAGLSVGLAASIAMLLFVHNELTFDAFNRNEDRIYRVIIKEKERNASANYAVGPIPLGPALLSEFPEIKSCVRFFQGPVTVSYGANAFSEDVKYTDPGVFSVFSFRLLEGNPSTALTRPNSVVLSESTARKIFGGENPISRFLKISSGGRAGEYMVTGIVEDVPDNSSIDYNLLMPITEWPSYDREKNEWGDNNGSTFVLLSKSGSIRDIQKGMSRFVEKYYGGLISDWQAGGWLEKARNPIQLEFEPLSDVHFSSVRFGDERLGNPIYSYVLSIIAFIILSIACINFITLSLGNSTGRTKEVGVRKVLGAGRSNLVIQFWGQSLILTALSFCASILLVELLLPVFDRMFDRHFSLASIVSPGFLLILVVLVLLVGVAAGAYPSIVLSRFQPAEVLKGKQVVGKGSLLSKLLVVVQFGLAIFLIIASLVVWLQLRYAGTRDLGYNGDQVIVVPVDWNKGSQEIDLFKNELAGDADVLDATGSNATFGKGWSTKRFTYHGKIDETYLYRVDANYVSTLQLHLVEGRNFRSGSTMDSVESVIVNQSFTRYLGWEAPVVGKEIPHWNWSGNNFVDLKVIGVVKDYNYLSLHDKIQPVILTMDPDWSESTMMIKVSMTNIPATIAYIEKAYTKILPNRSFDFSFLNENVQKQYDDDRKWGETVGASSILAIMISCLGLFGLATLAIAGRTKEVGIRKVLGASAKSIFTLFSKDFLKLVIIANIMAWPVGWYASNKWLQSFAYRINLTPWIFLLAAGLAFTISLVTIAFRTIRAATANPVESLRYE